MTIAIFSGSDADRPIVLPVLEASSPDAYLIPWTEKAHPSDTAAEIATLAADATAYVAETLDNNHASCLVIAGDRAEALGAALAATCMRIPIVHLHGGETSLGAIDNKIRYAISALASVHCVSLPWYKDVLFSNGYPTKDIYVTGAPSLDGLFNYVPKDPGIGQPFTLVAYHPATLGESPEEGMAQIIAMTQGKTVVYSPPNTDEGHSRIVFPSHWIRHERGTQEAWWDLMAYCDEMIGNSSSMLYDAPVIGTPTTIIGHRQDGRKRVYYEARPSPRVPLPCELCDGKAAQRVAEVIKARFA